jgi:Cu+-exporting ATPase
MKIYFIPSLFIAIVLFALSPAAGLSFESSSNTVPGSDSASVCPVTGDAITNEFVAYRYIDKDIKFCNEGCIMAFKKEPSKYSEHLKCMPCGDDDADKNISSVHNGVKYYFCGNGCRGKFEKDPQTYLDKFTK